MHLKAKSICAGTWLPLQWVRGHTLGAISNLYQDQPRKGNDSGAIANPKGPFMARGTQLVKHSNCLNTFQLLHAAIDERKWREILYFPTETSQTFQIAGMQLEPGCLAKLTKFPCEVWKGFTLEIFIYTLSISTCAPYLHLCAQHTVLNPLCVKYLVWFLLSCLVSVAGHTTHTSLFPTVTLFSLEMSQPTGSPALLWFVLSSLA